MALKILYFAWIKEKVGFGEEMVTPPPNVTTASELMSWLRTQSPAHAEAFDDISQIRIAVDQVHSLADTPISKASEVAFFPPVTGG